MTGISQSELSIGVARGVIRGDRGSIADAYKVFAQPVMNLAARILKDRQLAEEVVQDTFIDLVEKSTQIREASAIAGWVRTVATNHCLMKLRSPWHARRVEIDSEYEANLEQETHSPDMANIDSIEKAFGLLGTETRAVVWLHDVEGYTHKEIGELMGKTTSYSKSQLARGYEKLLHWRERHNEQSVAAQTSLNTSKESKNVEIDRRFIKPTCAS